MQVAGNATLPRTAEEQEVSAELLTPYTELLERRPAGGHGQESTIGAVEPLDLRPGKDGGGLVPEVAGAGDPSVRERRGFHASGAVATGRFGVSGARTSTS